MGLVLSLWLAPFQHGCSPVRNLFLLNMGPIYLSIRVLRIFWLLILSVRWVLFPITGLFFFQYIYTLSFQQVSISNGDFSLLFENNLLVGICRMMFLPNVQRPWWNAIWHISLTTVFVNRKWLSRERVRLLNTVSCVLGANSKLNTFLKSSTFLSVQRKKWIMYVSASYNTSKLAEFTFHTPKSKGNLKLGTVTIFFSSFSLRIFLFLCVQLPFRFPLHLKCKSVKRTSTNNLPS